jgi:TonB-dependent starch-binding outer membrane protein SusC
MARNSFLAVFVVCLCGTMILASDGNGQSSSVHEIDVAIATKTSSLTEIFEQIEKQTSFRFSYFKSTIKNIHLDIELSGQENLGELLNDISASSGLSFRRVNDRIYVSNHGKGKARKLEEKVYNEPDATVKGTVVDEAGDALPGVNVIVKGTTTGTITDSNGAYSLLVPENASVLIFSFIGYQNQEIDIAGRSIIDVSMVYSSQALEEVVVIGFGERRKKDLTGSISTVGSDAIEKSAFASPQFALQGNTTGVRVINTSGDPNAPPQIYVRGIGSWQGNAQPLYVIDGQIITPPTAGNLDLISRNGSTPPPNLWTMINPDDIESISVLKDASSAAIYGSRGANGVVLITTKKGKKGTPTVEFSSERGWQNINTFDMLNTQQYVDIVEEMYANNLNPNTTIENQLYGRNAADDITRGISFAPQFDPTSPFYISSRETYDWQDELVRKNATTASNDIKVSGANDYTDYYISIGNDKREGMIMGNNLETWRAAVNVNTKLNNWLKVGVNYKFANQKAGTEDYESIDEFSRVSPWQPLYDASNKYGYAEVIAPPTGNWQPVRIYGPASHNNVLARAELNRNLFENQRNIGQGYIELTPLEGLSMRGSINIDYTSQDRINVNTYRSNIFQVAGLDPTKDSPAAPNSLGAYESRANYIYNYQSDFTATYDKAFGQHRFTVTGVVQDQLNRSQTKNLSGENLNNINNLERIGFGADLANNNSFTGWSERFWFGYVGRINYIYNDKYYLDVSARRDASSGMDKDYRWGNFYSVSGAWRLSGEAFMDNVSFINDLKLRAGYGEAGNDEAAVGRYAYLSTASRAGSYRFGSGNGDAIGNFFQATSLNSFPNRALVWEVAKTTYIGVDALLLNNKMNVTVELFNRAQDGIQQIVNLPLSVGLNDPLLNVGELVNKGVDLQLGYNDQVNNFTYGASANVSFLKNEVTRLYNGQPLSSTNQFQVTYRVEEGRSLGHIWGYKSGGIFQSQQEIDDYYASTPDATVQDPSFLAPGDMYFVDVYGNPTEEEPFYSTTPDGQVNTFDQTEIGNTIPGMTYGINLNAGYKGFDLSLSFYGEANVDKYNSVRAAHESMSSAGSNFRATTLNRWTESNKNTSMPRAVVGDPGNNNRYSDRFVESAAFFRLNSWQLGYSIPSQVLGKINYTVRSLRLYVGGQNNIYINSWSGIDPVNDRFPLPKTFMVGLKAKF